MNFSDAEIVWSVLQKKDFTKTDDVKEVNKYSIVQFDQESFYF